MFRVDGSSSGLNGGLEAELRRLRLQYCSFVDSYDVEGVVQLFTESAICEFPGGASWHGHDKIRRGLSRVFEIGRGAGPWRHVLGTTSAELVTDDRARGLARVEVMEPTHSAGVWRLRLVANYTDCCLRTRGQWKIERTQVSLQPCTNPVEGGPHRVRVL